MKYEKMVREIVEAIGGKENILNVYHCATRLRFQLKQEDTIQDETVKNIEGVLSVVKGGGQYQIVIGTYDCDRFDGCNGRNLSDPFHCRGLLFLLYARLFRIYGNEKIRWDSVCWNGYRCSSCVPVYCGHYGR